MTGFARIFSHFHASSNKEEGQETPEERKAQKAAQEKEKRDQEAQEKAQKAAQEKAKRDREAQKKAWKAADRKMNEEKAKLKEAERVALGAVALADWCHRTGMQPPLHVAKKTKDPKDSKDPEQHTENPSTTKIKDFSISNKYDQLAVKPEINPNNNKVNIQVFNLKDGTINDNPKNSDMVIVNFSKLAERAMITSDSSNSYEFKGTFEKAEKIVERFNHLSDKISYLCVLRDLPEGDKLKISPEEFNRKYKLINTKMKEIISLKDDKEHDEWKKGMADRYKSETEYAQHNSGKGITTPKDFNKRMEKYRNLPIVGGEK